MLKKEKSSDIRMIERCFKISKTIIKIIFDDLSVSKDKIIEDSLINFKSGFTDLQKIIKFFLQNQNMILNLEEGEKTIFKKHLEVILKIRNEIAHQQKLEEDRCIDQFEIIKKGIFLIQSKNPIFVKDRYYNEIKEFEIKLLKK